MDVQRTCGGCTECCTLLKIEELNKPPRQHCQYECPLGCAIYGQHPPSCQSFECVWLRTPEIPADLRPDKIHMVMYRNNTGLTSEAWNNSTPNIPYPDFFVVEDENYEPEYRDGDMGNFIESLIEQGAVMLHVRGNEKQVLWRDHDKSTNTPSTT